MLWRFHLLIRISDISQNVQQQKALGQNQTLKIREATNLQLWAEDTCNQKYLLSQ